MEDRLDSIFSMQKGLADMMNLDRYPKDTEGKVSALCTAIMHEAVELQHEKNQLVKSDLQLEVLIKLQ